MSEILSFPNGFSDWHETHFEIVQAIALEMMKDEPSGIAAERHEQQGHGGLYELAKELTDKFEEEFKDIEWGLDLEYFDKIEEFIQRELYP